MESAIQIQLPVSISYPALEEAMREKMIGSFIPPDPENPEDAYAQIQDVSITGLDQGGYNILLKLRISILRTLLKRDNVVLHVPAVLAYENVTQQLFVRNFKVDSRTNSGFFDAGLELLANSVAYDQILKKARVPVGQIIAKEKGRIDAMLAEGMEPVQGIKLKGEVTEIRVDDIFPQLEKVSLKLMVQANIEAEITDLAGLIAARPGS